jgi:DNA-binding NarL/FixJ family response regulator
MSAIDSPVARARASFNRREWGDAFRSFVDAQASTVLDVADLERLAAAAYLTGHDDVSDDAWTRAHEACQKAGDEVGAGRSAAWLGWNLLFRGDMARATGWLARANALLVEGDHDCAARGLLLVLEGLFQLDDDPEGAFGTFATVADYGDRFGDRDLFALGRLGCGQARIAQGELAKGSALLDEAMVAVTAGEVTAPIAGVVYCAVLLECHKTFDARRAREWTDALTRWCDAQPDLVPYRGQCLVHRSEVLQLGGEWASAFEAASRACEALAGHPAIGDAYYQQAEMYRLRGEHDAADAAYRGASRFGREPYPGLALLRLSQGDVAAAVASIRRVAEEARDPSGRAILLAAYVEIMLAAGDGEAARTATEELAALAVRLDAPMLRSLADQARGAVLLADGDTRDALDALRSAWSTWQSIGAPYESARVRALIGAACRSLGDHDAAELELDAARATFESLGAAPELARLAPSAPAARAGLPDGLTAREAEVLALVAAGKTNREIAEALVISDHTVRRHLQNVFAKIGVTSRAGATAYAFTHGLV